MILTEIYPEPPFCKSEILRYAGCGEADPSVAELLSQCIEESKSVLTYKLCHSTFDLTIDGDKCDFGVFRFSSKNLARNLYGCSSAVVFAATVGVGFDRLISRYGRISPSKALMFQAIGAERIEALCDTFCESMKNKCKKSLRPRFSPGYGDLALECQKNIFSVLDCERKIGLTLNDSLLMSPSKSVTAIVGIDDCDGENNKIPVNKCAACGMRDCTFRDSRRKRGSEPMR